MPSPLSMLKVPIFDRWPAFTREICMSEVMFTKKVSFIRSNYKSLLLNPQILSWGLLKYNLNYWPRFLKGRSALIQDRKFCSIFVFTLIPMHCLEKHSVLSLLNLEVKTQKYFVSSSDMFLDKKTLLKIWLNPGLNLTSFRGSEPCTWLVYLHNILPILISAILFRRRTCTNRLGRRQLPGNICLFV